MEQKEYDDGYGNIFSSKDEYEYFELIKHLWYSDFFSLEEIKNAGKNLPFRYKYHFNRDLIVSLCEIDDDNNVINIGKIEPMIRKNKDKMIENINKEKDIFLKKIEELNNNIDSLNSI